MKALALEFYEQENCCGYCIMKSVEIKYSLDVPKECYDMLSAASAGFGIGELCSAVMAGVMAFGLMFDEQTAKKARILYLSKFQDRYECLQCAKLQKCHENCGGIIGDSAGMVEEVIEYFLQKKQPGK